jgi:4a-hydroxytetrahydrobiopterin dehydratase
MTFDELARAHCSPLEGEQHGLHPDKVRSYLDLLPRWTLDADAGGIRKEFRFENFHQTMAFVNAVAWIAHVEDHHPDFKVSYPSCELYFSTHDVGGLSLNDFICACKVEMLLEHVQ